jgi:multiple sugar transport system permease protein
MTAYARKRIVNRGLDALTWLVLLVMLAPILWLVAASVQTDGQLSTGAMNLLDPTFTAFSRMWKTIDFERYLINSLIICTVAAAAATGLASFAGYALARFSFKGSRPLTLGVIGTQLIPGSMFLLPTFIGMIWLKQHTPIHLFDTRTGMILVYTAFFTPVAIFFMRYFFSAIPKDLEEAAMVDGCSPFGAFVRILLPAAAPGLLATFVYAFLFAWDELLFVASLTQHNA